MSDTPKVTALTDDEGQPSSMRRMCAWALTIAGGLALADAFGLTAKDFDSQLILYFLMAAFGGKAGQKFAEKKNP